jgi:hypothetical protein
MNRLALVRLWAASCRHRDTEIYAGDGTEVVEQIGGAARRRPARLEQVLAHG